MKQIMRVLGELENGPAHAQDIADEIGLSKKAVSAYLSELAKAGLIKFYGEVRMAKRGPAFTVWQLT